MSQIGANFEIKFLIVYRDFWLTLMLKKSVSLKIRHLEINFPATNTICIMTFGLPEFTLHSSVVVWPIFVIENKTYQSIGNTGAKTVFCCYQTSYHKATHNTSHTTTWTQSLWHEVKIYVRPTSPVVVNWSARYRNELPYSQKRGSSILLENEQKSCLFHLLFQVNKWIFEKSLSVTCFSTTTRF